MKRVLGWLIAGSILFAPTMSWALQLTWSSGGSNLNFTAARACTLLVGLGIHDTALPQEWRLLWALKTRTLPPVSVGLEAASGTDTAHVCTVHLPGGNLDEVADAITVSLCSSGATPTHARYVFNVPAGAIGKFQIVSLVPTSADTSTFTVLRSTEATLNGGLTASYPPAIFRVFTARASIALNARALGVGLGNIARTQLSDADTSWQVPMNILSQNDSVLTATANISANLPGCTFSGMTPGGRTATAYVAADASVPPPITLPAGTFRDSSGYIEPKDFALIYDYAGQFHLFYTRHSRKNIADNLNETKLGHVWSQDLNHWTGSLSNSVRQDTVSFQAGAHTWDALHVWSPSIIQYGGLYYMFYTGVDASHNQRIGYATTSNILADTVVWTRQSSAVFDADSTVWASRLSTIAKWGPGQQFRDPYVTEDPEHPGKFLMYYAAVIASDTSNMSVGVARSVGTGLGRWQDLGGLYMTSFRNTFDDQIESPHAFLHVNTFTHTFGDSSWYLFYTEQRTTQSIAFWTHRDSMTDTSEVSSPSKWTSFKRLYPYEQSDANVASWNATEYLKADANEYLAAYNDGTAANPDSNRIWIRQMYWTAGAKQDSFYLATATVASVLDPKATVSTPKIALDAANPSRRGMSFAVELPAAEHVRVEIFDVLGRRIDLLADGTLPAGRSVRAWNGVGPGGGPVRGGLYFARLRDSRGVQVVRFVLLR